MVMVSCFRDDVALLISDLKYLSGSDASATSTTMGQLLFNDFFRLLKRRSTFIKNVFAMEEKG
ncbi:hypothetical protein CW304_10715 [Bacillus sp. UFRGS-B20]|nr:hypothetical protein CW304_10715 [Bacillus sp. UFRGS-B20]